MSWSDFLSLHFVPSTEPSVTETPVDSNVLTECATESLEVQDSIVDRDTGTSFIEVTCGQSRIFTVAPSFQPYIQKLRRLRCSVVPTQIVWKPKNDRLCVRIIDELEDLQLYPEPDDGDKYTLLMQYVQQLNTKRHPHLVFPRQGASIVKQTSRLTAIERVEYFKQCIVILECLRKTGCAPLPEKWPDFFVLDGATVRMQPYLHPDPPSESTQNYLLYMLADWFYSGGNEQAPDDHYLAVIADGGTFADALCRAKEIQATITNSPYVYGTDEFNTAVTEWFTHVSQKEPKLLRQLAWASRLYSFMMDEFINDATRGKITTGETVLKNIQKVLEGETPFGDNAQLKGSFPGARKYCQFTQHPFEGFEGPYTLRTVRQFVERVDQLIHAMYKIMTNPKLTMVLKRPLVVYRGGSTDFRKLWGFASTSVAREVSEAFGGVKQIRLPAKTRVVPIMLCTVFNEQEVLVASQGELVKVQDADTWEFLCRQPLPPKPNLQINWPEVEAVFVN